MKKCIFGISLVMILLIGSASAAVLLDTPCTPTQDHIVELEARWENEESTAYELQRMPADLQTVNQVMDVYDFVCKQGNRPISWFPEETQKDIKNIISVNPNALYITEFMCIHASEIVPPADLEVTMTLAIDYKKGQQAVIVLGDYSDPENPLWTAVESRVIAIGKVEFHVPQTLMEQLQGKDLLLCLMTVRQSVKKVEYVYEEPEEVEIKITFFARSSKVAGNTIRISHTEETVVTKEIVQTLSYDFDIVIVSETEQIKNEIALLGQFVTEMEQPALKWFPEEDQELVRYLLGVDGENLIVSDYVPLNTVNFIPSSGDAIGTISFATPYSEGQNIVTALGIYDENADNAEDNQTGKTHMKWSIQPAFVRENGTLDVVFDQMSLIDMGTETGLLIILSEPAAEE